MEKAEKKVDLEPSKEACTARLASKMGGWVASGVPVVEIMPPIRVFFLLRMTLRDRSHIQSLNLFMGRRFGR